MLSQVDRLPALSISPLNTQVLPAKSCSYYAGDTGQQSGGRAPSPAPHTAQTGRCIHHYLYPPHKTPPEFGAYLD